MKLVDDVFPIKKVSVIAGRKLLDISLVTAFMISGAPLLADNFQQTVLMLFENRF